VSTVNYLAAGSCNFNDNGVSLWPLDQIVHDTQYYVRDAVIDYVTFLGTVSPAIEGRLALMADLIPPTVTSIVRVDPSLTNLASVDYTVTFSEDVTGVDVADFVLTATTTGASVAGVTGTGSVYTVTVYTGTGPGTIRLDLDAGATILDLGVNPFVGPYTGGEVYNRKATMTLSSIGTYDGWVLEYLENSNTGSTVDSTGTHFRVGDALAARQYRAILHFNTGLLPDTAVVTKVTLKVKKSGVTGTDPFTILGTLRVDMSKPYFGTAPLAATDFQAAAGLSNVAILSSPSPTNWSSGLLNALGKAFINLTGVTQFRLRFSIDDNDNNAPDYVSFFSGNYSVVSARPVLIIEYYVP
jgi:hypothetical protein